LVSDSRGPVLDLSGEVCPYTFVRAKLRLEELPLGACLEVIVDHAPAVANLPRSLAADGHEVEAALPLGGGRYLIRTRKRTQHPLLSRPHLKE
jgi:tRNA 2-thiouridine synthesizing protein A